MNTTRALLAVIIVLLAGTLVLGYISYQIITDTHEYVGSLAVDVEYNGQRFTVTHMRDTGDSATVTITAAMPSRDRDDAAARMIANMWGYHGKVWHNAFQGGTDAHGTIPRHHWYFKVPPITLNDLAKKVRAYRSEFTTVSNPEISAAMVR